jgi:hypothetical protein
MGLSTTQTILLKREIPVWIDTLYSNGFSAKQISFTLPQLLVESGYFTSPSYLQDINPLGIKYKPTAPSVDTTQGRKSTEGDYYARFKSKDSLAKEYKRILNLQRTDNKIGKPIDATSLEDFNNRLYANGYYAKDLEHKTNYLKGLISANKNISIAIPDYLDQLKKKNIASFLFYTGIILFGMVYIIKKIN